MWFRLSNDRHLSNIAGKFTSFRKTRWRPTFKRRGGFLTIFRSHKNLSKLFWSMSWSAFDEIHLETRLVERLNDLRITTSVVFIVYRN